MQGTVTGVFGGAAGGYTGSFTSGLIMTGDIRQAHKAGLKGMALGTPIGGLSGAISAYSYSIKNDINPWTGKTIEQEIFNLNYGNHKTPDKWINQMRQRGWTEQ